MMTPTTNNVTHTLAGQNTWNPILLKDRSQSFESLCELAQWTRPAEIYKDNADQIRNDYRSLDLRLQAEEAKFRRFL